MYLGLGVVGVIGAFILFKQGKSFFSDFGGKAKSMIGEFPGMEMMMGQQESMASNQGLKERASPTPSTQTGYTDEARKLQSDMRTKAAGSKADSYTAATKAAEATGASKVKPMAVSARRIQQAKTRKMLARPEVRAAIAQNLNARKQRPSVRSPAGVGARISAASDIRGRRSFAR